MQPLIPQLRTITLSLVCFLLPALSLKADEKTEPPVPIRTVAPDVPASFTRDGSAGLVTINFLVDDKGNVQEPTVVKSTHSILEEPALKAIKKWRFKPAKKDGEAVAVHVTIPMKFDSQ
jgi:periplasmic protein TonB